MNRIDQLPCEEDVADFTSAPYSEDREHKIRISNGINLSDLGGEGVVFDPELPDEKVWEEDLREQREYFAHHEELGRLLGERRGPNKEQEDDEHLEDLTEFEQLKRDMEDVTESKDGGVLKSVIRDGFQTEGCVPPGATVTVHYSLSLEGQDEPFDSTVLRGRPERYKLDNSHMFEGLEVGIKTMKRNEKARFMIDHTYAFGQFGCQPRIPEFAVVLASVELVDFVEEGQAEALLALDVEERSRRHAYPGIEKVVRLEHGNGNSYVRREEWKMALRHYERGVRLLEETNLANQDEEDRRQKLMLKLQLNVAHCCLKMKWPKKACLACRGALDIEGTNTKALFRLGKAQRMLEDYPKARDYLVRAQRNAPSDPDISRELQSLEDQLAKQQSTEKTLCQNMFSNPGVVQRRTKQEQQCYDRFLAELEGFREQPEQELLLPAQFSAVEMRALEAAGQAVGMTVVEEQDTSGGRRVRVAKMISG